MPQDARGLSLTAAGEDVVAAFEDVVAGYLGYRADLPQRLKALLAADPGFALAHCLKGYFAMLTFKQAAVPAALEAEQTARRLAARATPREQAHVAALGAWATGEIDRAIAVWESILGDYRRDVLALRLAHFANFWLGRPQEMAASVERVMPHWSADLPGFPSVLACRCFAQEECGNYLAAEPDGRAAIALDPGDPWAAHAVAHVLEMQGRRSEGIVWLGSLAPHWPGVNNLQHHLWWHCALFHLELGDTKSVLSLYDTRFRNLASPLTMSQPDLYIDVQNAASMLFRLERLGIDVGDRWVELADLAEGHTEDCVSAFTLPHWMLALAATGRDSAAQRLIAGMRGFGNRPGTVPPLVRDYALPVCEAIRAHRAGRHVEAVERMRPALGGMYQLGGSHVQQDVLEQVFLDAALQAGLDGDVRLVLERVAGRRPLPPERQAGWREAARRVTL